MEVINYNELCQVIFWSSLCIVAIYTIGCMPLWIYRWMKAENQRDGFQYQVLANIGIIVVILSILLMLFTINVNLE